MSSIRTMSKLVHWSLNLVKGMGDALFHPYRDNEPPHIGYQPFTGKTYKHRRVIT